MSKTTILNLAEATMEAKGFEIFFSELEIIRKEKPEQFINTIISYQNKASSVEAYYLLHRLKLTTEEFKLLVQVAWMKSSETEKVEGLLLLQELGFRFVEIGERGTRELHQLKKAERQEILDNIKFTKDELLFLIRAVESPAIGTPSASIQWKLSGWQTAGLFSATPEPSGEELLNVAFQKIIDEKNYRKPSQLERFVEPRTKKAFPKKGKPFTNEQVKEGVDWYIATRKKITVKKATTEQPAHSRYNVPHKEWNAFMLKQFGSIKPTFARQYKKAVGDEVRKITKPQGAQKSSK
jgi:hypothetical protein